MTQKRELSARLAEIVERGQSKELRRYAEIDKSTVDVEARTVEVAFSSEFAVKRWFYDEVLSHDVGACRMGRLENGAALLWGHDWNDQRGVVESARIDGDRKGRALLRFSKSAKGEELLQDVLDGIVRHISFGYFVHGAKLVEESEDRERWLVTDWEPYEISFVSVPADPTVGVGRSAENSQEDAPTAPVETADTSSTSATSVTITEARSAMDENELNALREAERAAGSEAERARIRSINNMAERYGSNVDNIAALARAAAESGSSVEEFSTKVLEALNTRASQPLSQQAGARDIGLTDRETRQFSILRAARALMEPTDRRLREAAAFEFEVSEAARANQERQSDRFVIPTDVLRRSLAGDIGTFERAPLSSGNTGGMASGGNLIANNLMAASFIDILRNRATIMSLGSVMGGLQGTLDIPKQIAGASGSWIGEDDLSVETGVEFGQIPMSPKTVSAFAEITRRMLMQPSLDAEALIRRDLAIALALTADKAGYYGSGSANQPRGILNTTGINAVAFAAVQPTFPELVAMETVIATDNADVGSMAYVANAAFRGHAKTTLKFSAAGSATLWEPGGQVNGYRTEITNQLNTGDVVMGNFADFLIGMWGGLELTVDPYSGSQRGRLRLVVFQDMDFAVRRTESFCLGRM